MTPQHRRVVPVAVKVLLALAGLGLAVVVSGDENDLFNASEKFLFWSTVSVGVLTFADGGLGAVRELRGGKRGDAEARVQKVLIGFMLEVSNETSVQLEYVGASVFRPAWRMVRLESEFLPRPRRVLVRLMRFRILGDNQPSKIARIKGKGAVGECWATKRVVPRAWYDQASRYGSHTLTMTEFEQIPADKRDGFDFNEFRGIAHKYSEVLAAPILSDAGDVLGVLSVDVAVKAGLSHQVLDHDGVRIQAEMTAAVVRDDLKHLYAVE